MKLKPEPDNLQIIRSNSYSILKKFHDFGDPRKREDLLQHKSSTGYYLVECLENLTDCFHECFDGITDDYVRAKLVRFFRRMDRLVIFVKKNIGFPNRLSNSLVPLVLSSHSELFRRIKESQIRIELNDDAAKHWSSAVLAAIAIWGDSI